MASSVRISEIGLYLRCPRLVYFQNLRSVSTVANAGQMLLRALMLSLSSAASSTIDLQSQLEENLSRLEQELPLVYDIDAAELQSACLDLKRELQALRLDWPGI